jgi:hypothetical protein
VVNAAAAGGKLAWHLAAERVSELWVVAVGGGGREPIGTVKFCDCGRAKLASMLACPAVPDLQPVGGSRLTAVGDRGP